MTERDPRSTVVQDIEYGKLTGTQLFISHVLKDSNMGLSGLFQSSVISK